MSEQKVTWLTQDAYDRLAEELTEREEVTRAKITRTIELAREEGDLKENGGYHAAKEDQGRNEARIRELKHLLEHARVGRPEDTVEGAVSHGSTVTIEFPGGDREAMLVASREEKEHIAFHEAGHATVRSAPRTHRSVGPCWASTPVPRFPTICPTAAR